MNDNVQNMIGISAILALFLSACFLALGLTRQIDGALDEVSAVVSGQKRSVHSTLTLARPDIFSGSQAFWLPWIRLERESPSRSMAFR